VKQHGGWINVYSEPGSGTVFKIYLPAIVSGSSSAAEEKKMRKNLRGGGERILLVEDEAGIRKMARRLLEENGYRVTLASSVREALDIVARRKEKFDLLFSDVVLPDQSGLSLADRLADLLPGLKILMTSGYLDDKAHWPDISRRGIDFLQKPFSRNQVLQAVKSVLKKKK
jgi:DNA-binding NtrC family response regulator